ncbi:hypothetical protein ACJJTC_003000, partial [Scirpophaga incertulas]
SEVSTVIDIVQESIVVGESKFYGIYCLALPTRCFGTDGKRMLLSTPQQNEIRSYVVDLDTGSMVDISNSTVPGSTVVLDVASDVILATCSNITTPSQLHVARLPPAGSEGTVQWTLVSQPASVPAALALQTSVDYLHLEHPGSDDAVKSFTAIYVAPKSGGKVPLIVWPHGGPHSGFVNSFSMEAALFTMLGFSLLQVNYRGSVGAGQASVDFLPQRIGGADVVDCKLATDEIVGRCGTDRVGLTGGSHGGFLVTHLSGQYPETYHAVVARNPVIDVASMVNSTDIPD